MAQAHKELLVFLSGATGCTHQGIFWPRSVQPLPVQPVQPVQQSPQLPQLRESLKGCPLEHRESYTRLSSVHVTQLLSDSDILLLKTVETLNAVDKDNKFGLHTSVGKSGPKDSPVFGSTTEII